MTDKDAGASRKSIGLLKLAQSILAAAFGVQSSRRHEEDFNSHSPFPYILGGLLFTVGFVGVLILIVYLVLSTQ